MVERRLISLPCSVVSNLQELRLDMREIHFWNVKSLGRPGRLTSFKLHPSICLLALQALILAQSLCRLQAGANAPQFFSDMLNSSTDLCL